MPTPLETVDSGAAPRWILLTAVATLALTLALVPFPATLEARRWIAAGALLITGAPLAWQLLRGLLRGHTGADLLAGVSIVTSLLLQEYVAGLLVVTMLAGGQQLESYALGRASSALKALADRMPRIAHRYVEGQPPQDIAVDAIVPDDQLLILPHEIVPVDGVVVSGHTRMNEAYLTGEPWELAKAPGATVISGAINGNDQVVIRATRVAHDSRYAQILEVMKDSENNRPRMQRLADTLGAWYTPLALAIAALAWLLSGDPIRFLSVLVVATPCPLLIAIPVALAGTVSQAARRGIVIRNPAVLETIDRCETLILDKTGTLTAGEPVLVQQSTRPEADADDILRLVASLETYSRHPLAQAIVREAQRRNLPVEVVSELSEPPGQGLTGRIAGRQVELTSRKRLLARRPEAASLLSPTGAGLECVVLLDGEYAATYRFEDAPRPEGLPFIRHLGPRHALHRVMIVSGDRESEVASVGAQLGITELFGGQSPADKVRIVREVTAQARTLYVGDGINDAPALAAATVGVAFGRSNDVAAGAAHAVILEPSLARLDELMHLGRRLRSIALQSALGGMALSIGGMGFAAVGLLGPVVGALLQEGIDLLSILNALRTATAPRQRTDWETG
jgi:heavy metal translocating P-type ATPase